MSVDDVALSPASQRGSAAPKQPHDLTAVVHVHSTYSNGTATVSEIVEAAADAEADAVLLTDDDTLQARRDGHEGWHQGVLLLVGLEISATGGHILAFGVNEGIEHDGRSAREICAAVEAAGALGFPAHPFSEGSRFARAVGRPHPLARARRLPDHGHRAVEPGHGGSGALPQPSRARVLHQPPGAGRRASARAQHGGMGPSLPRPARGGDRWARRAPERGALPRRDGAVPAAQPALLPHAADAPALRASAEREARGGPRPHPRCAPARPLLPRARLARRHARVPLLRRRPGWLSADGRRGRGGRMDAACAPAAGCRPAATQGRQRDRARGR